MQLLSPISVYIHVPFCSERCHYCAFNTYTDAYHLNRIDAYLQALKYEMQRIARYLSWPVHTVYFGGGTPGILSPSQFNDITSHLRTLFQLNTACERSLEVNPGMKEEQKYFQELLTLGFNRLSIGMQSAIPDELILFGRTHTVDDVAHTFDAARKAGFQNINLDLIYGAPYQTLLSWEKSLAYALALHPEHVSLYALILKSGTAITRQIKAGKLPPPDDDLAADMYDMATEKLQAAGFEQYEISNWAKPGFACEHNLQYWHNHPYVGLGAGAHGYLAGYRTVNVMRPEVYIERLKKQNPAAFPRTPATQSAEKISREVEMFETIMLNLRLLKEGLSKEKFETRFGELLEKRYGKIIRRLVNQGLLKEDNERLLLTPQARLISNRVFEAFLL